MTLSKQRKAQLDRYLLNFNRYATRIIEAVSKEYPRSQISMRFLMNCYGLNITAGYVIRELIIREKRKGR